MAALLDLTLNVRRSIVLAATRRPRLIQEFPHLWQDVLQGGQSGGVSEQTFHRWRQQYGGMKSEEAKRLKQLEEENKRLKKVVAELTLDKDILQEALKGNY